MSASNCGLNEGALKGENKGLRRLASASILAGLGWGPRRGSATALSIARVPAWDRNRSRRAAPSRRRDFSTRRTYSLRASAVRSMRFGFSAHGSNLRSGSGSSANCL